MVYTTGTRIMPIHHPYFPMKDDPFLLKAGIPGRLLHTSFESMSSDDPAYARVHQGLLGEQRFAEMMSHHPVSDMMRTYWSLNMADLFYEWTSDIDCLVETEHYIFAVDVKNFGAGHGVHMIRPTSGSTSEHIVYDRGTGKELHRSPVYDTLAKNVRRLTWFAKKQVDGCSDIAFDKPIIPLVVVLSTQEGDSVQDVVYPYVLEGSQFPGGVPIVTADALLQWIVLREEEGQWPDPRDWLVELAAGLVRSKKPRTLISR